MDFDTVARVFVGARPVFTLIYTEAAMATAAFNDARAPLRAIRLGSASQFQLDCCDLLRFGFFFRPTPLREPLLPHRSALHKPVRLILPPGGLPGVM
jgi:hypothetical protein